jgi:outer membrane receptor protein involved in Fe transport
VKLRYLPVSRHAFWGEAVFAFAGSQHRISSAERANPILANGNPSYQVFSLRGGANITPRISATVAIENLFDEAYRYHGSLVYEPGRELIVSTQYRF